MKCRDCKWMYSNETLNSLYICVNGNSKHLGEFTGICSEDECDDGEGLFSEREDAETL